MAGSPDGTLSPASTTRSRLEAEMIDVRRDLHANPELSWPEERTTGVVAKRLADGRDRDPTAPAFRAGGRDRPETGPVVVLRADLDALPVDDRTDDPWRSTVDGRRARLRARRATPRAARRGPGPGRAAAGCCRHGCGCVFQPAEEVMPGGALRAIEDGGLEDAAAIYMLHCDPTVDVGTVGLREGPITGAADAIDVRLSRHRRAHVAAAPDPGPHLRARQARHRAARGAVPPARPPRGRQRGLGLRAGRRATNVIPTTGAPAAPSGCSTRSPGPTRRP